MIRILLAAIAALGICGTATAQGDDAQALKKRILEKVRKKLADERAAFLERIEAIIDEEFARKAAPPPVAKSGDEKIREIERKIRKLQEEKEVLAIEKAKKKRMERDKAVIEEAKKKGPHDGKEAGDLFRSGIRFHEAKKFDVSINAFKRIYYNYPDTQIGFISAYNVACGYALDGKKDEALDWLEVSIERGYEDFEHLRVDPDLDTLRKEKRYKRLLTDR